MRASVSRVSRSREQLPFTGRPAAVLLPIFEEDGEARIVLTRRAATLRSHTSEVAFPGGRIEDGETAVAAALREAQEEVALDPASVEVIGELTPLATLSASAGITPVVGLLATRPVLVADPTEVEHIFDVALADLLADEIFAEERWDTPFGDDRSINFFHLPDDIVWGATARILRDLLERVVSVA